MNQDIKHLPTENLENILIDNVVEPARIKAAAAEYKVRPDEEKWDEAFDCMDEDVRALLNDPRLR